jgi:hypothetical protein
VAEVVTPATKVVTPVAGVVTPALKVVSPAAGVVTSVGGYIYYRGLGEWLDLGTQLL